MTFTFTFTGLSYLIVFISLSLLSVRFFQYWRKDKSVVSKMFFFFSLSFLASALVTLLGSFLFVDDPYALKQVVIFASLSQTFMSAFLAFVIFYLKFKKISPWVGFFIVFFLGLLSVFSTVASDFYPYLAENLAIDWDIKTGPNIFRTIPFLITLLPASMIFFQEGKKSLNKNVKIRSYGLGALFFMGLLSGIMEFMMEKYLGMGAVSSDIAIFSLGVVSLLLTVFTQKPPSPKYVTKIYE